MITGIVGLGVMGFNAAKLLRENGICVHGYDPFPAALEKAAHTGVVPHDTPGSLAGAVDCLLLFVPGPKECEALFSGEEGLHRFARPGAIVLNASTVDPDTNIRIGKRAEEHGIAFLDTPVLGLPSGVGNWAVAAGGDKDAFDKVLPVLSILSGSRDKVFHVGQLGDGNKLKLLNNLMYGAINACAAEIMALADRIGVSQKSLFEIAAAAKAGSMSNLYREIGGRIIEGRYDAPGFTVDLLTKDNHLCVEMAKQYNIPLLLGNAVDSLNRLASLHGLGKQDTSAMWKMLADHWNGR